MLPDSDRVARLIADIAAAEIMPRFERLAREEIREKRPGDLVTIADIAAEERLEAGLRGLLPGSRVVGEEGVAADPELIDTLDSADPVWLVDPLDGTVNFAAGRPVFAVMVALVRHGATVMGWIHDPVKQITAAATAGGGAWCAGERLSVARTPLPGTDGGTTGFWFGNRKLVRNLGPGADRIGSVFDLRCAGQEYLALASGRAHFALYNRLYPWDHAAGELLHREAGGFAARLDGSAYAPRGIGHGLLLAPDGESWRRLRELLIAPG
ncbi:MAG TPA: inositol monophosphatase [Stellaceae bacterium]|nr:inositol monophosphatase [Stellaceae bacterium]